MSSKQKEITVDFLVIGSSGMGMAFVDIIINHSTFTVCLVDKYHTPGGHWTLAYDYVKLHQPQSYYGVNSMILGNPNEKSHLATKYEILSQYEKVINKLINSNRLQYYPSSEQIENNYFISQLTGEKYQVNFRKFVDSTYMKVEVPAMISPKFKINNNINIIPLNDLISINKFIIKSKRYIIIGSGKTGIDAILYLINNKVNFNNIYWIMPSDAQCYNREKIQPNHLNFYYALIDIGKSKSLDDMFNIMERNEFMLRIDKNIKPGRFRCAIVTKEELSNLQMVNIIRYGRVVEITDKHIIFNNNKTEIQNDDLLINCTANGIGLAEIKPPKIFNENKIILYTIQMCQPVYSAAIIAQLELIENNDEIKNKILYPVPHPIQPIDFIKNVLITIKNSININNNQKLSKFKNKSRLNPENYQSYLNKLKITFKKSKIKKSLLVMKKIIKL